MLESFKVDLSNSLEESLILIVWDPQSKFLSLVDHLNHLECKTQDYDSDITLVFCKPLLFRLE
mgnify:CR=1 FL=1